MQVQSLDRKDPLEEEMATHSSILAWKIPWTEEPGKLQSKGLESNTTEVTQHMHLMIQGCRSERDETWRPQPPIELGPYRWKQVEDVMDS